MSRQAADLFWRHGVDGTSGDAIAEASGLSKRTVWRYFRSKEACVEPLLLATELRFVALLREWPPDASIEHYLRAALGSYVEGEQAVRDGVAATRIVALLPKEPVLRSAWLMACAATVSSRAIPSSTLRRCRPPTWGRARACCGSRPGRVTAPASRPTKSSRRSWTSGRSQPAGPGWR